MTSSISVLRNTRKATSQLADVTDVSFSPNEEGRATSVVIIGAGPAGLTAAYQLAQAQVPVTVLESDPVYVGGISRTVRYKGYRFDIGGHRFFSKSKEVEDFWTEILPDDMITRARSSRIYYRGKFFSYPLKAGEALWKLGIFEAMRCALSYVYAHIFPVKKERSFEDWVTNRFGTRLFNIFFKTYTEKVWGMSCKEISADWAAQRIKGLSLKNAILNAILPKNFFQKKKGVIKTLIDTFRYPRFGPGQMWEVCAEKTRNLGGVVHLGSKVISCHRNEKDRLWEVTYRDSNGTQHVERGEHVISSAPIRELVKGITPVVSEKARGAAESLKYRDFITVALIVPDRKSFSDNWVYIHDPSVHVGRVQNFKSWSPELIGDPGMNCYGLEYFCFEGDGMWNAPDTELLSLAKAEIEKIGLVKACEVVDGCVVRQAKAYPVYDDDYASHVNAVREELEAQYPTLHLVGRNGMHKYNNQDHAMMTAMLCVRNILAGRRIYDLWNVNQDAEYHESGAAGQQELVGGALRLVPRRLQPESKSQGK